MKEPIRSFGSVRKLNFVGRGNNASLTLPREISQMLQRAGIKWVRVTTTTEGILVVPYKEPDLPDWAVKE
jgi:hypothetical protein